jgi:hypothetical protein
MVSNQGNSTFSLFCHYKVQVFAKSVIFFKLLFVYGGRIETGLKVQNTENDKVIFLLEGN